MRMRSILFAFLLSVAAFGAAAFETYEFRDEAEGSSYAAALIDAEDGHPLRSALRDALYGGLSATEYAAESWASFAEAFTEFAEGEGADFVSGPDFNGWYLEERTDVLSEAEGMAVVAWFVESYQGGAHPNHSAAHLLLDSLFGGPIFLSDFLLPEAEEVLSDYIDGELRALFEIGEDESLDSGGLFIERGAPSSDFYPAWEGLVFHWNPYEIAAYAFGDIDILVPYEILDGLLTPRGAEWIAALFPFEEGGGEEDEYGGEAEEEQ